MVQCCGVGIIDSKMEDDAEVGGVIDEMVDMAKVNEC